MHGSVVLPIPFFHCPSFSCKSPLFHRSREREVSFFESSCLVFFSVVPFSWLKETLFARSCFHSPHARVPRSISLEEGRGGEHRQLTSLPITLLPPSRPLAKTKANTNTNTYKFRNTPLTWLQILFSHLPATCLLTKKQDKCTSYNPSMSFGPNKDHNKGKYNYKYLEYNERERQMSLKAHWCPS